MIRKFRRLLKRLLGTSALTKPAAPVTMTPAHGSPFGAPPLPAAPERKGMRVAAAAVAAAAVVSAHVNNGQAVEAYSVPPAPAFVTATPRLLDGEPILALDDMGGLNTDFANFAYGSYFKEGLGFLGYPYLAELSQRAEYRRPVEIIAKEMTRKWIKFTSSGDTDKTQQIQAIEAAFEHFHVKEFFKKAAEGDGYYGRHQLFVDTGDNLDPQELMRPMIVDPRKYAPGFLRGFRSIEPLWSYPSAFNATDPLEADFYKPPQWFVQAKTVHTTRMLTFVSRPMPDILKPAYAFGGLALTQIMKPYVDNWLETRQGVNDLVQGFSTWVLKTDMGQVLQGGDSSDILGRVDFFTRTANNRGAFVIDKDTEDFANVAAPLSGLDKLQAQAQEHMAAVCGIPLVILLGVTPSGLNASSEGEIQAFYSWIKDLQEQLFRPNLQTVLRLIQLHLWGAIDPDIGFQFIPLWEDDATTVAQIEKTKMETATGYINAGVIAPEEERARIAADEDSMYLGVDLSSPPPEPPDQGFGEEGDEDDGGDGPPDKGGGGFGQDAQPAFKEDDHPRDEAGRFAQAASGSGGVKQAHADFARAQRPIPAEHFNAGHYAGEHDDHAATAESVLSRFAPEVAEHLKSTGTRALNAESTHKTHRLSGAGLSAEYVAERKVLHDKILSEPHGDKPAIFSPEKIRAATPPPGVKPVFMMLGGRGGSGKSKFENLAYDPARTIVLDADRIKEAMPEYEGWNANQVHEESGDILERALKDARDLGVNVVLDATMKSLKPALEKLQQFQDAGYETEANYMHLPRQEAAARAVQRHVRKTNDFKGRFVPPEVVLANVDNERNFDEVRKLVDRWAFYDNHNVGEKDQPRLISKGGKAGT